MEDEAESDAEKHPFLPVLESVEANADGPSQVDDAAVSFSFPVCCSSASQLNQVTWFQNQEQRSTTPELSLYAGLPVSVTTDMEAEDGSLYNLLVLSLGFFFMFSAYNTLGEFVTSVLPNSLGDKSMLLNNFIQSLAVFAAPGVVATAGEARSMALGGLAYVVYIASLITGLPLAILTASALLGLGSSIVWVAQGSFLTRCCPAKLRGAYSGVFYCFYFSSNILGNVAAYYAFRLLTLESMFSVFALVAMMGVAVLLQLTEFPATLAIGSSEEVDRTAVGHCSSSDSEEAESDGEIEEDLGEEDEAPDLPDETSAAFVPSVTVHRCLGLGGPQSRMTTLLIYSLLAPMSFYTGFEGSFWSAQFTKLIPPETIGLVLAVTGIGEVIGAFGLGMVSDYLGRRAPTFVAGSLLFLYGLYMCIPLYEAAKLDELLQPTFLGAPVVAYMSGFAFGVGDGVFSGHMFTVISSLFAPEDLEAWALFNLLGTLGSAAAYAYGLAAPLYGPSRSLTQVWTQAGILIIGTVLYVIVDTLLVSWQRSQRVENLKKDT